MSGKRDTDFHNACREQGGTVYDLGKDWICVDGDGRVIKI